MPRKTRTIKQGAGLVRITFLLEAPDVRRVDDEAARLQATDRIGRAVTRTDALRVLIREALDARDGTRKT